MRLLAFVDPGDSRRCALQHHAGHDAVARFPELAGLDRATRGLPAVLDGEIAVLDETGRPSFGRLQTPHPRGRPRVAVPSGGRARRRP